MNTFNFAIDLHCHPAMKPFGRSFDKDRKNSKNPRDRNSIWHYDPPNLPDKLINYLLGLTKFRQSDFTSLHYGNVRVISASLYPLEKGFVVNKLQDGKLSDVAIDLAAGLGRNRIDHLQALKKYFPDLEEEYNFYRQLDGQGVKVDGKKMQYKLVSSFNEIEVLMSTPQAIPTVAVFLSIEGGHVFNCGLEKAADPAEVLANVAKVKAWPHAPFFITLAHHFYNELCSHAKSLSGIMEKLLDQSKGMESGGIRPLGHQVIDALLDKTQGKRILIDVKHMSPQSRREYFNHLDANYAGENIPIIVSHGAANGLKAFDNRQPSRGTTSHLLNQGTINFYDDELIRIAQSKGLIGLQMDERRAGSPSALQQAGGHTARKKILFHRSKLIWHQLQHIAEVLSAEGIFPWGITAIGSDYDGIIDPINGYWTEEDVNVLDDYLLKHAYNFMTGAGKQLPVGNTTDPEEIVARMMCLNAWEFLSKNY